MAGRPGRSGGHNRLSLATHVIRGTFNPTRHGKLTAPGGPVWQPTAAELAPDPGVQESVDGRHAGRGHARTHPARSPTHGDPQHGAARRAGARRDAADRS